MTATRLAIRLFVSIVALSAAIPTAALAGPRGGVGIGPRIEDDVPGIGIDYWTPRLGVSGMVGGRFSSQSRRLIDPDGDASSDDNGIDGYAIRASIGLFLPLAQGERTRLALGLRAAISHADATAPRDTLVVGSVRTTLSLQVPLRLQWFATDRIAIHADVGLGVQRASVEDEAGPGFPDPFLQESTTWTFEDFASPLGNLGVTYYF